MAKVIISKEVVQTWQPWMRVVVIGAGLGVVAWLLTRILSHYIVEPMTCRQLAEASLCVNATPLAGNLAAIFTALIGAIVFVRLRITNPLVATVAAAALLWNMATWTLGLAWGEALVWNILLYAMSYLLFVWIVRYCRLWVTIAMSVLIIVIIHIALVL